MAAQVKGELSTNAENVQRSIASNLVGFQLLGVDGMACVRNARKRLQAQQARTEWLDISDNLLST